MSLFEEFSAKPVAHTDRKDRTSPHVERHLDEVRVMPKSMEHDEMDKIRIVPVDTIPTQTGQTKRLDRAMPHRK
jgi:hypothetical protein